MEGHFAKFSNSIYNGWSVDITGIKKLGDGAHPLGCRVCLTHRSLPWV